MNEIVLGVIANAIYGILVEGGKPLSRRLESRDPRVPAILFSLVWLFWFALNGVFSYFLYEHKISLELYLATLILSSLFLFSFHFKQFRRFWTVGISDADPEIRTGINYAQALRLCRNQLEFLGIGAAKLSSEAEFTAALLRCRQDRPIKLLLCKPTASELIHATRRAGRDPNAYRRVVSESLRRIALLKNERDLNMEVRFYNELPFFRLMFIDDSICLASYNVIGEGDGSQLPQLHIVKPRDDQRITTSFFYPLKQYFDYLWERGEAWNFADFLDPNV